MPPLGEVPITSYFQINPSSRKRKAKSVCLPPQKKHKNYGAQTLKDSSLLPFRSSEIKGEEHGPSEYATVGTHIRGEPSQNELKRAVAPGTPHVTVRENEKAVQLKRLRQKADILKSQRTSHPGSAEFSYNAMERGASSGFCSRETLLSKLDVPELPDSSICSYLHAMDRFVPSSQSQNVLLSPTMVLPVAREEVQHFSASKKKEYWPDLLDGNDAHIFVTSSQTQLLDNDNFIDIRQQKNAICRLGPSQDIGLVEFIPSSQSQEHELMLPSLEAEAKLVEKATCSIPSPPKADVINENNLSQVVSKKFSSISIRQPLFDDLFETVNPAETSVLAPRHDEELSLMESESETDAAETKGELGNCSPGSSSPAVYPPHPLHGDRRPLDISVQGDPPDSESLPSQPLPEDGSLPPVVKDFQNMFGDFEDSFPPDFPMSLR